MGVPGFPYIVCPHPITNVGPAGLAHRAELLAPQVAKLLQEGSVPAS